MYAVENLTLKESVFLSMFLFLSVYFFYSRETLYRYKTSVSDALFQAGFSCLEPEDMIYLVLLSALHST